MTRIAESCIPAKIEQIRATTPSRATAVSPLTTASALLPVLLSPFFSAARTKLADWRAIHTSTPTVARATPGPSITPETTSPAIESP